MVHHDNLTELPHINNRFLAAFQAAISLVIPTQGVALGYLQSQTFGLNKMSLNPKDPGQRSGSFGLSETYLQTEGLGLQIAQGNALGPSV